MYQDQIDAHREAMRDFAFDHNEDPDAGFDDDYGRDRRETPFTGTSGFEAEHGPDPQDEEVRDGADAA